MSVFAVYNSNEVLMILADIPITQGFADPFLKISKDAENFEVEEGACGGVCRNKTNSRLYTLELTLKGWSPDNAKLSALAAIDTNTKGGAGVGGCLVKDMNGSSIFAAGQCWIQKPGDAEFGKARGDVLWTLKAVANPGKMFIGGNKA